MISSTVIDQREKIDSYEAERLKAGIPQAPLASRDVRPKERSQKPKRQNHSDHYMIDRMHRDGILTDDQWQAGVHIRYWHDCLMLSHLRSRSIDTIMGERGFDPEALTISRLTATDLLMKTMIAMQRTERSTGYWSWQFCYWLCIDDLSFSAIAKARKMRKEAGIRQTKDALDQLYAILDEKGFLFWQRNRE